MVWQKFDQKVSATSCTSYSLRECRRGVFHVCASAIGPSAGHNTRPPLFKSWSKGTVISQSSKPLEPTGNWTRGWLIHSWKNGIQLLQTKKQFCFILVGENAANCGKRHVSNDLNLQYNAAAVVLSSTRGYDTKSFWNTVWKALLTRVHHLWVPYRGVYFVGN